MNALTTAHTPSSDDEDERTPLRPPARRARNLGEMVLDAAEGYEGIALEFAGGGHDVSIAYRALGSISLCDDAEQAAKLEQVRDRCPSLEHVVLFTGEAAGAITLEELRTLGAETPRERALERMGSIGPGDLELGASSVTHFPAVPRIYEKIHGAVTGKVADGRPYERALFQWAVRCGGPARRALRQHRQPDLLTDLQYRLANRWVLSKVREVFGGELQVALVGAAPIARELLEFFDACGVAVLERYGLTESCAAAALNVPSALRFGSVGKRLPGTEIAIAPDGEVLISGPHVFKGYYKDPDATARALTTEGWLRSGDLGAIDGDGFLSITGRKKELIITSSGKNITPVNIESELRDSRYVTEAVVYGDNRPYLVAMLTLDREESMKLAERLRIPTDPVTIAADPRVHAEVQKEVDRVNGKFARIEQIKRFAILGHDLTQADGELTPTLKVKRALVYDKYADVFDGLYTSGQEESRS